MAVKDRVLIRKPGINETLVAELEKTATDRILLRIGETALPAPLESICVEIVCAMYNRSYHEGIKTENVDTFSVSFVDDILKEYETELNKYINNREKTANANRGVLRFI